MKCEKVFITCSSPPYWQYVESGAYINGCQILLAIPRKCYLAPGASVEVVSAKRYEEVELQSNYKIVEYGDKYKSENIYVFPKKPYLEIKRLYIEPLKRGERPLTPGLLLIGPPGVGKSSLARIVANMLGIPYIVLSPDSVLSKYVGESEQRLKEAIEDAERSEPSIVIIDDAEWIMSARKLSSVSEHGSIMVNLLNILFNEMQRIYEEDKRMLFIASTNIKPSEIDQAFLRQGRFGDPIFIPLPDYEATYTILSMHFPKDEADRLARKAVNLGLSVADIHSMIVRSRHGLPIERKASHGRGYARIYVEPVAGFEKIFDILEKELLLRRSRLWIPLHRDTATAIIAQVAYHVKRPVIKVTDYSYIDEATYMANSLGAITIVPSSFPEHAHIYIDNNSENALIFTGKNPPSVSVATPFHISMLGRSDLKDKILEAVSIYIGLKIEDHLKKKILAEDTENFIKIIDTISILAYIDERTLARIRT